MKNLFSTSLFFILISFLGHAQHGLVPSPNLLPGDTVVKGKTYTITNKQGIITEVYRVKKGLKHGKREVFNHQGNISAIENYKKGFLHGVRKEFDGQGNLMRVFTYKYFPKQDTSLLHGKLQSYMNNKLISEKTYKKGKTEGPFRSFHHTGALSTKGTYVGDIKTGKFESFDINGKRTILEHYLIFDPNEDLVVKRHPKLAKKSVLHGKCQYFAQGVLIKSATYNKGVLNGVVEEYYPQATRQLRSKTTYKDGKNHGPFENYQQNGLLERKGNYFQRVEFQGETLSNVYEGENLYYNRQGLLERVENWKNYKKNGPFKRYHNTGELYYEIEYKDNLKTGTETWWDKEGNKSSEIPYKIIEKDGELAEVKHGWVQTWKNGQLESKINYENGLRQGIYSEYYPSGQLKTETTFVNDSLNGRKTLYYEDGKISYEHYYLSSIRGNNRIGWSKSFEEDGTLKAANYEDGKGKYLLKTEYLNGKPLRLEYNNQFVFEFLPNQQLSGITFGHYARNGYFYFYSNGTVRRLGFHPNNEPQLIYVNFSGDGEALQAKTMNEFKDESILKQAQEYLEYIPTNWGENTFFTDTLKNGKYQFNYKDNTPFLQMEFKDNLPNGDWTVFDAISKDTLVFYQYIDGKNVGNSVLKRTNGTLINRVLYDENEFIVESTSYFINGDTSLYTKYDEATKYDYHKKIYRKEFYENGVLKEFRDDVNGINYKYKESGALTYSMEREIDLDTFRITKYYYADNDSLQSHSIYNLRTKNVSETKYYKNGNEQVIYQYDEKRKKFGDYRIFFENGQLKQQGWYNNDKKDGIWLTYNEEGELLETEEYIDGELQIDEELEGECACYDKSIPAEQIKFAMPVSSHTSFKEINKLLPNYVHPIDSLNFNSIFYINFQGDYQFAMMKLLFFRPLSLHLGNKKATRIDLLPCRHKGCLDNLDGRFSSNYGTFNHASIDVKRMAVQLENNPLADTLGQAYKAYFDGSNIELRENKLKLDLAKDLNACLPKGRLMGMTFDSLKGAPYLNSLDVINTYSLSENLPLRPYEVNDFNGLVFTEGNIRFKIYREGLVYDYGLPIIPPDVKVQAKLEKMVAGENWVAASIIIPGKLQEDEDTFVHENQDTSLKEISRYFRNYRFLRIEHQYLGEDQGLRIHFFIEN